MKNSCSEDELIYRLEKEVEQGNTIAMLTLADYYHDGFIVEASNIKYIQYLEKVVENDTFKCELESVGMCDADNSPTNIYFVALEKIVDFYLYTEINSVEKAEQYFKKYKSLCRRFRYYRTKYQKKIQRKAEKLKENKRKKYFYVDENSNLFTLGTLQYIVGNKADTYGEFSEEIRKADKTFLDYCQSELVGFGDTISINRWLNDFTSEVNRITLLRNKVSHSGEIILFVNAEQAFSDVVIIKQLLRQLLDICNF